MHRPLVMGGGAAQGSGGDEDPRALEIASRTIPSHLSFPDCFSDTAPLLQFWMVSLVAPPKTNHSLGRCSKDRTLPFTQRKHESSSLKFFVYGDVDYDEGVVTMEGDDLR